MGSPSAKDPAVAGEARREQPAEYRKKGEEEAEEAYLAPS